MTPGDLWKRTSLQSTPPPVFTGNGSLGPEKKKKKKQPAPSEGTQIYKIETRIYKMMYIVLVDLQTIKLQSANPREFMGIRILRPSKKKAPERKPS